MDQSLLSTVGEKLKTQFGTGIISSEIIADYPVFISIVWLFGNSFSQSDRQPEAGATDTLPRHELSDRSVDGFL